MRIRDLNVLIKPASSLCNMRCKYCFYADEASARAVPSYGMMSGKTLENTVRRAFECAEGSVAFVFQGGEPTLAGIDYFRKAVELQSKYNERGIETYNSIQTNGLNIDDEWAEFFAKNRFLVGLSIDGIREAHDSLRVDSSGKGTYSRAEKAAGILRAHGAEYNVLCVVNNYVARYPQAVYGSLKRHKYVQFIACLDGLDGARRGFSLTPDRYSKFLISAFSEYYKDFKAGDYVSVRNFDNYVRAISGETPESCGMRGVCGCNFTVESDGSVFPCDFYVLDEYKLGSVNENSFGEMLASKTVAEFIGRSQARSDECSRCEYFIPCRGGCYRERANLQGDEAPKSRFCSAYKAFFQACGNKLADMAMSVRRMRGE